MKKEENKKISERKNNKKNLIFLLLVFVIVVVAIAFGLVYFKNKNSDFYNVEKVEGFIYYDQADTNKFEVNADGFIYGPYQLLTTKNNYILVQLVEGDGYKNIGYIKLYRENTKESSSFVANWYSDNINFLCIKVRGDGADKSHWYFLDENGNLIQVSDKILEGINSGEQDNTENNLEIDNNLKEDIEDVSSNINNVIYTSEKNYNGFNIGITKNKEIIVYKATESGMLEVFTKLESYLSNDKLNDVDYIKDRGPGFYADWNNAGSKQIRIRVDKYINNDETNRYGHTWYTLDENAKVLESKEFIESDKNLVYKYNKNLNGFNIGVTKNKEIIVYKVTESGMLEVFTKFDSFVSNDKLNDINYVKDRGPGFYADWNNAGLKQIRIRVDKYINNDDYNRYSHIWYTLDENAKVLESKEFIESDKNLVYKYNKNLNGFNIGVTKNKEIIVYKVTESGMLEVFTKFDSFVSNESFNSSSYIKNYGPGFYADWNNAGLKQIRIRVDKYINNDDYNRYSYIWYTLDEKGNLLDVKEYFLENNTIYNSSKKYGDFNIGITKNKELILYKSLHGVYQVFAKFNSFISNENFNNSYYIATYGPGFYADWNNAGARQIRIRVDKYIDNDDYNRYGYTWYTLDEKGNLLSSNEYISKGL